MYFCDLYTWRRGSCWCTLSLLLLRVYMKMCHIVAMPRSGYIDRKWQCQDGGNRQKVTMQQKYLKCIHSCFQTIISLWSHNIFVWGSFTLPRNTTVCGWWFVPASDIIIYISSVSSNSEADASKLLEILKKWFLVTYGSM